MNYSIQINRLSVYLLCAVIFFLTIATSNSSLKIYAATLPWIMVAFQKKSILALFELSKKLLHLTYISISLCIWLVISSFINSGSLRDYTLAATVVIWLPISALTLATIRSDEKFLTLCIATTLSAATALISCMILWQKYLIGIDRPFGTNHNVLIGPTLCIIGITAYVYLRNRSLILQGKTKTFLYWILFILVILSTLSTDSRTALIFIFSAALIALHRKNNIPEHLRILAIFSLVGVGLIIYKNRMLEAANDLMLMKSGNPYSSIGSRFEAYQWGFENLNKSGIFGYSSDGIKKLFNSRYHDSGKIVEFMPHLHNDFLQMALGYGFISSFLYAGMIYFISSGCSHITSKTDCHQIKINSLIDFSLKLTACCLLISSLFDSISYNTEVFAASQTAIAVIFALRLKEI